MTARSTLVAGCAAAAFAAGATAFAQDPGAARAVEADDLRSPSTPAAAILGTSPTAVERPDSPRALVFNLAAAISDAGGTPQNYAAQLAPYWLRSHPDLLFNSYVNPSIGESLARSFAVSIATADWKAARRDDLGSRLAVGVSAVVLPGTVDPALSTLVSELAALDENLELLVRQRDDDPRLAALEGQQKELSAKLSDERDAVKLVELSRQLADTRATIAAIASALDARIAGVERSVRRTTLQIQTLNVQRLDLQLVVAAASSWQVPDDVFGRTRGERAAVWVTPSYRSCVAACDKDADPKKRNYVDGLGVLRYVRDRTESTNGFDLGGRVVWEITSAIAVSGEVVRRWWQAASASDNSVRAVGVFEARLGDKAYLFTSFGLDFTDAERERTLVSIVGLNVGFGEKPTLALGPK